MKSQFAVGLIALVLILSACGRDDQGGVPAPASPNNPPIVNTTPAPAGGYTQGGGYCGLLCRWRMRRQQRWQGC